MSTPNVITHPVFGRLSNRVSDLWVGTIEITLFGTQANVELLIDIDRQEGVESQQIAAFNQFVGNQSEMLEAAERAIFEYYQRLHGEFLPDGKYPAADGVADMARLVTPTGIMVPYATDAQTIGLLCECVWQVEHGLAVKFEYGNVAEVGFQDIVL